MNTHNLLEQAVNQFFTSSDKHVREKICSRAGTGKRCKNLRKELEFALTLVFVDIASCDDEGMDSREYQAILDSMRRIFGLGVTDVQKMISSAQQVLKNFSGVSSFARLLKDNLSQDERRMVQEQIQDIIKADGIKDGFEIYFAKKYEKLLDLPSQPEENS